MCSFQHIAIRCKLTYALLASMWVAFKHLDLEPFRNIYLTHVRPKLEYLAPLLNSYKKKYIRNWKSSLPYNQTGIGTYVIERVHCHTTRLVLELREISYNETYTSIFGKPQVKRWYNNSLQVPEWFWQCGLWVVLWKSGIHCLRSPYEDKEKNSIMWHQEFFFC